MSIFQNKFITRIVLISNDIPCKKINKNKEKMPLFNKKFESKPIPPRTSRNNNACPLVSEDIEDYKQISLSLGNKELRFADGIWIYASRKGDVDDFIRLSQRLKSVEEENNMCELKIEVLLDLLAEHATELNILKHTNK